MHLAKHGESGESLKAYQHPRMSGFWPRCLQLSELRLKDIWITASTLPLRPVPTWSHCTAKISKTLFEYLSLRSLDNPNNLYRLFREPAGAEASYGLGLCHDPSNVDRCNKEQHEMPIATVLTILYTRNALCVEVSVMKSAYAYYPYATSPPSIDFNLGSQALHDNPDEEYYWKAVRDRIMAGGLPANRPTKVFLLGESTHEDKFRAVMEDALKSILGYVLEIYDEDPVFSAARGAAEFARRGGFLRSRR
jgi:hypothetical protein